jgi:ketosteroid isomerase-like protein
MRTKPLLAFSCLALLSFTFLAAALAAETKSEQALRELDAQWSKAAAARDVDKTVSYYTKDAIVMPPNGPRATTLEAVRNIWKDLLTSPGIAVSWNTMTVEIARSGELGYLTGSYELTMNDAGGKPVTDRGKYLEVWKKQADGSWKCVADIWNSDLPASAPSDKK